MINFAKAPGQKVLELGGGANRHPLSDVNVDIRKVPGVDFVVDFNKDDWPEIGSEEFDIALCIFCLEHVSYPKVPNFLKQTFRVLKPGGKAIFVVPNTEAQMKHILSKTEWDEDESCMIFGQQDYEANSHKAAFSPRSATKKFLEAGFENILISPFGQLETDMVVEASKPGSSSPSVEPSQSTPENSPQTFQPVQWGKAEEDSSPVPDIVLTQKDETPSAASLSAPTVPASPSTPEKPLKPAAEIYDRAYFDNYQGGGFLWSYPSNEILARRVLDKQPKSVLELGCARGYVLKRIQDEGILTQGLDASKHAWLTRVCEPINTHDLLETPWPVGKKEFDLVFTAMLLEHIPESHIPAFMEELSRVSARGLHGVALLGNLPNEDKTRLTIKDKSWWQRVLPENHEVVDIKELGSGEVPEEFLKGDGRIKLNLGSAFTQFHHGWVNIDTINTGNFPAIHHYNFLNHDVRKALPYGTGVVDYIFASHLLQYLTYEEGLRALRDWRRIIRPDGALRLVLPDCNKLCAYYLGGKGKFGLLNLPGLEVFDQVNEVCSKLPTEAGKLYSLLASGHSSFYDWDTLRHMLEESGWVGELHSLRTGHDRTTQIRRETLEMGYELSLFCDCLPAIG